MDEFDVIVIGGGIIGCGIARDAALRGKKVALFEKEDFGSGTSSRSTRLIHGGLRYLEMLDFGLVRQDLKEREILLKIAKHRVKPLPFLLPYYRQSLSYRVKLRLGMWLYDLLSHDKSLPKHEILSREETLRREPGLSPDGLQGAALYYDAQVSLPERLCMDNIVDAVAHGAKVFNHTEVIGLLHREKNQVTGVTVRDLLTGEMREVAGTAVINVAGPWLDRLTNRLTDKPSTHLRLTKGIHVTAPSVPNNALVLFSQTDGRLFFVIPWLGYAWVGTTDTDFNTDLDTVHATHEDVSYLLESVRPVLPKSDWKTLYFTTAGVRALVRNTKPNAAESGVSRKHKIIAHDEAEGLEGLVSILGGKLTAYRDIAEEAVKIGHAIPNRRLIKEIMAQGAKPRIAPCPPCLTASTPLPGGNFDSLETLCKEARSHACEVGLTAEQADHLVLLYGSRYKEILALIKQHPELGQRLADAYPDVYAQVVHAVNQEFARTACDFMMRRSMLFFTPDQGQAALPAVVEAMAKLFQWDTERQQAEITAYQTQVALSQKFRQN